jgi:hypothetical protein
MRNRVRIEHRWEEGALTVAHQALIAARNALSLIAGLPPAVVAGNIGKFAEFVQHAQLQNVSVAPGSAVQYNGDQAAVVDTIGVTLAAGPGGQGTAFELPTGTYLVDFENSNGSAWSLAVYKGGSPTAMAIDTNTIAGSSTATTWIHGRAYVTSAPGANWFMISPVVGTAAIPTAGTAAGQFIARLTILRLS